MLELDTSNDDAWHFKHAHVEVVIIVACVLRYG